jgi:hypothetical protein
MSILSADVTEVKLGNLIVPGLMDQSKCFYVAIPQIAALTLPQDSQNKASQTFKRLMGADFKTHKFKTKFNKNTTLAVSLLDFERLIAKLDRSGNKAAQDIRDALVGLSLHQLFSDAFGINVSNQDRQEFLKSRIIEAPNPWKRLYEKDACEKAFSWFGANFYWEYCYHWMTDEERAKLNAVNPPINGERKHRIHQYIEKEARERLTPKMQELCVLVDVCASRNEFITKYMRRYGLNQLELFDMN